MCEPTTIIAAVGLAVSSFGQYQQGRAAAAAAKVDGENQRKIAEYNAQVGENNAVVADRNADLAEQQATDSIRRGANEAGDIRDRIRRINATGRAVQGSTGLLTDEGNASDKLDSNFVFGELDALQTVNNAEREAYGFKVDAFNFDVEANNLRNQASLTRQGGIAAESAGNASASNLKQAGLLKATDTLVSGAASLGKFSSSTASSNSTTFSNGETVYWNSRR